MTTTIGLVNTSINSQNCHFFLLSFFLRNSTLFSTVTEQICIPANSHNGLLFSTSLPTLICLIKAILTEMRWYLFVALIWISLVIHDVETFSCICQPFVCLLWKNVYLNSLPIYKSDFFFFFLRLDVWVQYIYLGINLLSDIWLANIFSHSVCCLPILLIFFCCVEAIQFDVVC